MKRIAPSAALLLLFLFMGVLCAKDVARTPSDTNQNLPQKDYRSIDQVDVDKLTKDLNITAEQKGKLDSEKRRHREKMKSLQKALRSKRSKLTEELDKPLSDSATITSLSAEMKKMISEMIDERLDSIMKIKEILTPEQYKQFVEKKNEFMAKHKRKYIQ